MDMASDGNLIHDFQNYTNGGGNVSVPTSFQARAGSEPVDLAYVTPREQGILQNLKPGTPHEGPMGIPNYDDFDAAGNYRSGAAMSAAESSGPQNERMRADLRQAGISPTEAADIRSGAIAAGAGQTVNPGWFGPRHRPGISKQDLRAAKQFAPKAYRATRGSPFGIGNLFRGAMSMFGGVPGKVVSGFMTARDWAAKRGQNFGQGVKTFNQYPTLDRWMNRNTDKYLNKPYRGQGQGYNFSDAGQGKNLGLFTNRLNEPIGPGKRVGQDQGYYGPGSIYDNQGITGLDAYETFDDEVAGSKELANYLTDREQFPAYDEYEPSKITEQDDLSDIEGYSAEVTRPQYNMLKSLGQVGNTGGSADEIKGMVPAGTFDSITDDEWEMIFKGEPFKAFG